MKYIGNAPNATDLSPPFKNRVHNGAMSISQRYLGTAIATYPAVEHPVDRFIVRTRSSTNTTQRSTTAPSGFVYSTLVTIGTATPPSPTHFNVIQQYIEGNDIADLGWGTTAAKTVTLSFWVRSSLTGTFSASLVNGGTTRSYPFIYTISAANTFEYKTITIAGDTSGSWATDNTVGIRLTFDLGTGSNYQAGTAGSWVTGSYYVVSGCTKLVETAGATFYITGVQLEVGSQATEFEHRPYQQELALCQRYYWKSFPANTVPAYSAGDTGALSWSLATSGAITGGVNVTFPVPMRTTPNMTYYNPVTATGNVRDNAGDGSTALTYTKSDVGFFVYGTANAGNTGANIGRIHATAEDPLGF